MQKPIPTEPRDRFSVNLRKARLRAGVSQEALALRCDLHRTEISLLERGGREPRLGTIVKVASSLGVSVDELCSGIAWSVGRQSFDYQGAKGSREWRPRLGKPAEEPLDG
jgi:transcriptional regulator with XRE-family HTH domain